MLFDNRVSTANSERIIFSNDYFNQWLRKFTAINTMNKSVFSYFSIFFILIFFNFDESQGDENSPKDDEKSIFENNLIVPNLLPSVPKEICPVIYNPGLIIVPGQSYFSYQIQGLPDISWDYKAEKFYTVVVLGALDEAPKNIQNTTNENEKNEVIPPKNSWYQWVLLNIRKNNLNLGTTLQPYVTHFEPNGTHNVIYAFAVYEQFRKFNLNLVNKDNSSQKLLQLHFTPMLNFTKNFGGGSLLAGNFFYVVPKFDGVIRDSSPVRYNLKRELLSIMKPDEYVGI